MFLEKDKQVHELLLKERDRQQTVLNMIPSENIVSKAVREVTGSIFCNKYSEGYPRKRYYQGNENVDNVEQLAIDRAKRLFGAEHVNVQPYSGSPANLAIYYGLLKPGDKIMGMKLDMGGHLTHGHKVNFSSKFYTSVQYGVDKETGLIDMDEVRRIALREKPAIIVSGGTAYSRMWDFAKFAEIAKEVGAISFADISHVAGLIVGGVHPTPFPFTDVVMTTTHKTLRGPRGAIIMCKASLAKKIDRAVFPGLQGGPHENIIAAKAVAFGEALKPEFRIYSQKVVENAKILAETLKAEGLKLVTGGTDNHLILIDLTSYGPGLGKPIAIALEKAGICVNANTIPYDPSTPFKPSGIRLGTPIVTSRGMEGQKIRDIGKYISAIVKDYKNEGLIKSVREEVKDLCEVFPID